MSDISEEITPEVPITTIRTDVEEDQEGKTEREILSNGWTISRFFPANIDIPRENVLEVVALPRIISNEAWHQGSTAEAGRVHEFMRQRRESLMREISMSQPKSKCQVCFSEVCYSRTCKRVEREIPLADLNIQAKNSGQVTENMTTINPLPQQKSTTESTDHTGHSDPESKQNTNTLALAGEQLTNRASSPEPVRPVHQETTGPTVRIQNNCTRTINTLRWNPNAECPVCHNLNYSNITCRNVRRLEHRSRIDNMLVQQLRQDMGLNTGMQNNTVNNNDYYSCRAATMVATALTIATSKLANVWNL